jgi:hypothetical protein
VTTYCEGCPERSDPTSNCYCSSDINIDGKCPCINCIVKPICRTPCKPFGTYYRSYVRLKRTRTL